MHCSAFIKGLVIHKARGENREIFFITLKAVKYLMPNGARYLINQWYRRKAS